MLSSHRCAAGAQLVQRPARRSLTITAARKAHSGRSVVVSKTLIAKPEAQEEVAKLCAQHAEAALRLPRSESGLLSVQAVRDAWEPHVFHVWERFESTPHMTRHETASLGWTTKVRQHLQQPIALALYEWKDGTLGPASMAEGPKGEGGLDDATGASGAAGGASMKQTSASFDLARIEAEEEGHDLFSDGLVAAKKKIDDLKGMFGNLFGGKDGHKGGSSGQTPQGKEAVGAGKEKAGSGRS